MAWLPDGETKFKDIFIRFGTIHERDGRTDGQTDGQTYTACGHMPRLCIASRGINDDFRPITSRFISEMMQDKATLSYRKNEN